MSTTEAPTLGFTEGESQQANRVWKATCGPHALAAALGASLDTIRPAIPNYRGWMNPTQMGQALQNLGRPFILTAKLKTQNLCKGINRIQWEGPWLNPGVPPATAYHYTHWVAARNGWVLCTACISTEWIREADWRHFLLTVEPKQPFHITHHYEIPD